MQKVPPSQVRVLCCTPSPHDSEQVDHSPHIAQKPSSSEQSPFEQDLSSSPSPMQKVPPSQVRVLCCTPSPHDSEQVDHAPHIAQKPSSSEQSPFEQDLSSSPSP